MLNAVSAAPIVVAAPRSRPSGAEPAAADGRTRTQLSDAEQQRVRELQTIDRTVRAHEAAHVAAGQGVVTGGASFGYVRGPDGQLYAVSGEVPIDRSPGRTPEETVDKARTIQRAALAPADPSAQDRQVAALAARMESQALIALARSEGRDESAERPRPTDPDAATQAYQQVGADAAPAHRTVDAVA